ncbi:MAG: diacylglycerol kinase family lipid kinase [Bacteroidales bacterium]|nr:diacylglycerol kinase family lipid kinase [Bacteroidales bacterium]
METWKIIISKKSGSGKAFLMWPEVRAAFVEKGLQFSESFTEYEGHATELAREAISAGFRKIVAIGGDGAIHEILNGVMTQEEVPPSEITLAIIPVGSGNDWARLYDIPKDSAEAVDVIARGKTVCQDVVKVESVYDGKPTVRYMMNIGGLGIDSHVCYLFEQAKQKGKNNDIQYLKCLMKGFIKFKCPLFKVYVDDELFFDGDALSVALGNGKYCGGGMRQTPDADPTDGLIDITVIKKISKVQFMSSVKRLYDGSIKSLDAASSTRGKKIQIYSSPVSFVEVDGELVGHSPVTATIVPAAVNVVINNQLQ